MAKEILAMKKVSKRFGRFRAVKGVSLVLRKGEIFGLLGPNGAGKSTLTKIAVGVMPQDSGEVLYHGKQLHTCRRDVANIVSVVPQEECFYHEFTVQENIELFGSLYGISGKKLKERVDELAEWLNLKRFGKKNAGNLSGGYRRMLNIACSLVHDAEIIFMDEPTVGLDPKMRKMLWGKILGLKGQGKTICLTTHYMDEAEELSDRVALIVDGTIAAEGAPEKLISKYGGASTFVLTLETKVDADLIAAVKDIAAASHVRAKENVLTVSLSRKDTKTAAIPRIYKAIDSRDLKITGSFRKEPDLEDVFLNLTGEGLGEKDAGEGVKASVEGA